jgi:hypothetical protein
MAARVRKISIELVEELCLRFHPIARQLRDRHEGRETLSVKNEYDVQDLLHSLLRLYFYDIRTEVWTPPYAGGSSRMDFFLKEDGMAIETRRPGTD